jgi:hypothetical protein
MAARIGVHENRTIGLDHNQPVRGRQVSGQATLVVHRAASDYQAHAVNLRDPRATEVSDRSLHDHARGGAVVRRVGVARLTLVVDAGREDRLVGILRRRNPLVHDDGDCVARGD